jgi:hypothetical protein
MKKNKVVIQNPVAKFAGMFNQSNVFEDKTKFKRHVKHRLKLMSDLLVFA